MYILSKNKEILVNTDNVVHIYIEYCKNLIPRIVCRTLDEVEIILGSYDALRCRKILKEIPMFSGKKLYEMPKE